MPYEPKYLILHDYGQTPVGWKPGTPLGHNPYHALVHGGQVQYRYPDSPYAKKAPHAYNLNPQSIGLSWAGPVGGTPDPADLQALKAEIARIQKQYPGIQIMSHGEAYAKRGEIPQASKDGRGLEEASWRTALAGGDFRGPSGASGAAGPASPGAPFAGGTGPAAGSFRAAQTVTPSPSPAPEQVATPPSQGALGALGALDFNNPQLGDAMGALGNKLAAALKPPPAPSVNLVRPPPTRVDMNSILQVLQQRAQRQRGV